MNGPFQRSGRRNRAGLGLLAAAAMLAISGSSTTLSEQRAEARVPKAMAAAPDLPGRKLGFVVTYFWYAMYQGPDACPSGMAHVTTSKEFLEGKPAAERDRLLRPENRKELFHMMDLRGPKGKTSAKPPGLSPTRR